MRKRFILYAVVVLFFVNIGLLLSTQNQDDSKFDKSLESFLDAYWKFYPTAATLAGYHKYNDKLEELGSKNIEKRQEELDNFNQEFVAKINKTSLSLEKQIDYEMVVDAIDLDLLRHENIVPWEYNPVFYNEIFINSVKSLLTKEFAPLDTRIKSLTERMKLIPGLTKQARENLKTPPQIFTETAIKQFPGILDFYRTNVPQLTESGAADLKSKLNAEAGKALAALEDYQRYLQNELLPKSTGNFLLGPQVHTRLLRLTAQNSLLLDDLISRSQADYNNIRREMNLVAMPFYRIMYPNINMEQLSMQYKDQPQQLWNIFIKGVFDKIKGEHVGKDEFIDRIKATYGEVKSFLENNQLIELPDADLTIEPMPVAYRGLTWNYLLSPGPYDTGGAYTFQVTPIPDDWDQAKVTSFLEEYNNFYLNFWTVRKLYPGWFTPTFFTNGYPSVVRKLFPNMALIKGWPVYIEDMMMYSGFGNYDLRLRLNQLKLLLKAVIDFQLDLNIHQAGMTKDKAIDLMTRGGFQTEAEAERKWDRIILKPGHSAFAYIGFQEILDMEKEYKKLKGDSFSQKEFLQKLLSYGAIPLRQLKTRMQQ